MGCDLDLNETIKGKRVSKGYEVNNQKVNINTKHLKKN